LAAALELRQRLKVPNYYSDNFKREFVLKTYIETRNELERDIQAVPPVDVKKKAELERTLGLMEYFCGVNLWIMEYTASPLIPSSALDFADENEMVEFLNSVPRDIDYRGYLLKAEALFIKVKETSRSINNPMLEAETLFDLVLTYDHLSEWEKLDAALLEAMEAAEKSKDPNLVGNAYMHLARTSFERHLDYISGFELLEKARDCYLKSNDYMSQANCLTIWGDYYDPVRLENQFGDIVKCEKYILEAAKIYEENNLINHAIACYLKLKNIFEGQSLPEKEEEVLNKCLVLVQGDPYYFDKASFYQYAAEFYESHGNKNRAAEWRKKSE
jgi:tetratricopeptide (TPR) repeat protein